MDKRQRAINNKRRGKGFEREIVKIAQSMGFKAKRAWGSDGKALGMDSLVDVVIETDKLTIVLQAKRKKRLPKWMRPSDKVNGQVIREDDGKAFVVFPLVYFLGNFCSYPRREDEGKTEKNTGS